MEVLRLFYGQFFLLGEGGGLTFDSNVPIYLLYNIIYYTFFVSTVTFIAVIGVRVHDIEIHKIQSRFDFSAISIEWSSIVRLFIIPPRVCGSCAPARKAEF